MVPSYGSDLCPSLEPITVTAAAPTPRAQVRVLGGVLAAQSPGSGNKAPMVVLPLLTSRTQQWCLASCRPSLSGVHASCHFQPLQAVSTPPILSGSDSEG